MPTVLKLNSSATSPEIEKSKYTEMVWKMIEKDDQPALAPEVDTDEMFIEEMQLCKVLLSKKSMLP